MSACPLHPNEQFAPSTRICVQRFEGKVAEASLIEVDLIRGAAENPDEERLQLVFDKLRRVYGEFIR